MIKPGSLPLIQVCVGGCVWEGGCVCVWGGVVCVCKITNWVGIL